MIEPDSKFPARSKILGSRLIHRWRIAFLAGRLSGGQSDFALRHGQPRHRIHHQQHVHALVAEVFRGGQRDERRADTKRRGTVGSRRDHHRTLHAFRTELLIEKRLDLAVALADQRDHADLGRIFSRHRAQQRALADAAAAEQADSLALAAGQETIDGTDAGDQAFGDMFPRERVGGRSIQRIRFHGFHRRTAVHGLSESVQHAAEQARVQPPAGHPARARSRGCPAAILPALPGASRARARCEIRSPACGCCALSMVKTSQKSPMATAGPCDSISNPTVAVTFPHHGSRSSCSRSLRYGVRTS